MLDFFNKYSKKILSFLKWISDLNTRVFSFFNRNIKNIFFFKLVMFFHFLFTGLIGLYLNIILFLFIQIWFVIFLFFYKKYYLCFQHIKTIFTNRFLWFIFIFFLKPYLLFIYLLFFLENISLFLKKDNIGMYMVRIFLVLMRRQEWSLFLKQLRLNRFTILISSYLQFRKKNILKESCKYLRTIIKYSDTK